MVRPARCFQRSVISLSLLLASACASGCGDHPPARSGADGAADVGPAPSPDTAVIALDGAAADTLAKDGNQNVALDAPLFTMDGGAAPVTCLTGASLPQVVPAVTQTDPPAGIVAPPMISYLGDPGRLPPSEVVSRLARYLWQSDPDAALQAQVAGCKQLTVFDVRALARQMLADTRGGRVVRAFMDAWLGLGELATLERDAMVFPPITPALRRSLAEEPRLFAVQLILNEGATLRQLLTAPYSFVNDDLARLYEAPLLDDSFRKVTFADVEQRAGLFTQPGVLALMGGHSRHSGPTRAVYLLDRVLCQLVPPPPPNVDKTVPPESARPNQTLRAAIEGTFANPACLACHQLMHLGFAFEPFDAMGRRRTLDNGLPIDASARVVGTSGSPVEVDGPVDLMNHLATQSDASICFVRRWLELALRRRIGPVDEQVWRALHEASVRELADIKSLIVEVTVTSAFLAPAPVNPLPP
jgi:hypothetical protein